MMLRNLLLHESSFATALIKEERTEETEMVSLMNIIASPLKVN